MVMTWGEWRSRHVKLTVTTGTRFPLPPNPATLDTALYDARPARRET